MNGNLKKVYVIKDLWDNTYKVDSRYTEKYGIYNELLIYAKRYITYEEAEREMEQYHTIITMYTND